ncbi:helix-turn-helix transcriptional regulator [Paenibacillus lycopersici]|uniref:Helix-turn-helix transcriptional regulator n=1 Tax=Paenibacillus lycopersici TaxID=2704462 RepID=A0A6C0G263_9BACL|nr:helix-turn-helix transcriptional regulator [Paenibacillus lycopersici]QHT60640.1 helix-turn-helix transcriptional regulator [Paenibacillus lycopersici]
MNNVGENIRIIRKTKGLSGKFVSEQVGIDPSTLSKYESNERKVKAELLPAIANALGVEVKDFFAEKVGETPTINTA